MHPFKYKMEGMEGMEGNELLGLQDERGIKFSLQSLVTRLWGFFCDSGTGVHQGGGSPTRALPPMSGIYIVCNFREIYPKTCQNDD